MVNQSAFKRVDSVVEEENLVRSQSLKVAKRIKEREKVVIY
jgi:hypothetical protein